MSRIIARIIHLTMSQKLTFWTYFDSNNFQIFMKKVVFWRYASIWRVLINLQIIWSSTNYSIFGFVEYLTFWREKLFCSIPFRSHAPVTASFSQFPRLRRQLFTGSQAWVGAAHLISYAEHFSNVERGGSSEQRRSKMMRKKFACRNFWKIWKG